MKKLFSLLAAALLVLSFAGAAFAIHAEIPAETQSVVAKDTTQLTLSGEIRFRGWYYKNLGIPFSTAVGKNPDDTNSKANYDQRVRLNVDIAVSPNVSGKIGMETGTTSDVTSWGNLNSKPSGLVSFQEAWIMYKGSGLFGFPAFLKIGHMPLKLSNGVFFDNTQYGDDAIVFALDPNKDLHIGFLTVKASEGADKVTDTTSKVKVCVETHGSHVDFEAPHHGHCDSDYTYVELKGPASSSTVFGGNGRNTDDLDAYVGLFTYKVAPTHTIGSNYMYVNNSDMALKFQNLGIHADGTVGNFGYKAEVDFQFGSVGESSSKSDFGGWGMMLNANYKMNPVNLRGMFAYGSGDKARAKCTKLHDEGESDEHCHDAVMDSGKKNEAFQTLVGGIQHFTFVYDYRAATAANGQALTGLNNNAGTGIANTTVYNLGLDYQATKDLSTKFDVYILRANETSTYNTFSKDGSGRWARIDGINKVSKSIGTEFDASLTYKVAKNLTYAINAGYLKTGDFYRDAFCTEKKSVTVLNNVLTLSF